jgi:hypothetical protein
MRARQRDYNHCHGCPSRRTTRNERGRTHDIGALGAMAQGLVDQHQGEHGFGNRRRPDADAGVVATVRFDQHRLAGEVTERRGSRMLEVGLMARLTITSWPVEMPPETPPAWLLRKALRRHLVAMLAALLATLAKPAPISTPLTALMLIIA